MPGLASGTFIERNLARWADGGGMHLTGLADGGDTRSSPALRCPSASNPSGQHVVDLQLRMLNQRDLETAHATATVALPSGEGELALYPAVPTDLQQQATRVFAHHNELSTPPRSR